jgi:hypothetical protein
MVCPFMFNVGDPPGFLLHIHSCWFISLIDELPFTSVQSIFQFGDHDFDDVLSLCTQRCHEFVLFSSLQIQDFVIIDYKST